MDVYAFARFGRSGLTGSYVSREQPSIIDAFCCISTGEFHFPNDRAAEIAVQTVREYRTANKSDIQVIFNVFKNVDEQIYRNLLTEN